MKFIANQQILVLSVKANS